MFARKFKKFFKKAKENSKKKNFSKAKNSDREQFFGCFKCGKHDHIVKKLPTTEDRTFLGTREKIVWEQFCKQFCKAQGDITEDDEASEEEEAAVALMDRSELDSDDKPLESLTQVKEKVSGFNKSSLKELLFILVDEYESVNIENCMLKDVCLDLKKM